MRPMISRRAALGCAGVAAWVAWASVSEAARIHVPIPSQSVAVRRSIADAYLIRAMDAGVLGPLASPSIQSPPSALAASPFTTDSGEANLRLGVRQRDHAAVLDPPPALASPGRAQTYGGHDAIALLPTPTAAWLSIVGLISVGVVGVLRRRHRSIT